MTKKVLVTGSSGFVAEHLIPKLKKLNYFVVGIDRKDSNNKELDLFIKSDLNQVENYINKINDIDLVIHLAAARADWGVSRSEFMNDNLNASINLIKSGNKNNINNWIFVSSVSTMPQNTNELLDEKAPYAPINDYGESKMMAEIEFKKFQNEKKIGLSIIRPTVLYGPSDPKNTGIYRAVDNNIFRLIDGIYNKRFLIVGDGKTIKTTAYVKNFVHSIIHAIPSEPQNKLYIYADQNPEETIQLVKIIRKFLGKKGSGIRVPYYLIYPFAILGELFSRFTPINIPITKSRIDTFLRPTNFRSSLLIEEGFKQLYSTDDALKETVAWYLDILKTRKENFFLFSKNIEDK